METPPNIIESLLVRVEAYIKTTLALTKFKTLETMSALIAILASRFIFCVVLTFFAIFLSIGFALYLGDMLEKTYYGFFIVAAFYLILGTVFYFFLDKWIKNTIGNLMIVQLNVLQEGDSITRHLEQ